MQAPPGQRFFQTEVQMDANDGGLRVQILAGIDLATGVVRFRLTAIDPQTGVRDYTVWVSEDGQPYQVWLGNTQQTQAVFDAQPGSRVYRFYVTATDQAGNVTPAPAQPQAVIRATPGDANGDNCVDDADLLTLLFTFGARGQNLPADFDDDGVVDDADLLVVLLNFGSGC